jgi:hypothetical protein
MKECRVNYNAGKAASAQESVEPSQVKVKENTTEGQIKKVPKTVKKILK